jgi:branched-chain amino acid transport system substrate-binding protein
MRKRLAWAGVASGGLLLGALVAGAAAQAAEAPGVTADSIKIGMFAPLTGQATIGSKALLGAAAIYKDANEKGGVNGRKFELVIEDDACDPNKAITAVKKLVGQEQVFMIHGGWCSSTVLAAKPELVKDPNLPFMILAAASAAISKPVAQNIFHPVATTDTVARTMVNFALSKPGSKRIAIISHSDEWGKSHLEPALDELKAKGAEPVETVWFERGSLDATSQTLRLREARPDVILAILYPAEISIFLRDAYKFGLQASLLGTQGVSLEDTAKRVGIPDAVKNFYVFYPLSETMDAPAFQKWVELFRRHYPNEPLDTVNFLSMSGSLAVIEAVKRLGDNVTREGLIAELDRLGITDFGIQSAPLSFTPEDHAGIKQGKMIAYREGKPTIVATHP